ncbi:hypothetical protein BDN72DRAFT_903073 [Pluteus cervinus]|uniref:Uncharacterized protein n=1 Tax=Pluteus cervinus TaxID=181527 RepID=A0ACD3AAE2_9AGAR|nr:hypothetical protein BDN72DRAFT_903073 [Pluteus cervinus]
MDASPVALPPVPRPLKRSASTASLPTPPRTRHKRKHRSKSNDQGGDTETDVEGSGSDSDAETKNGNKKRRTDATVDEDEDAFWLGSPGTRTRSKAAVVPAPSKSAKATTSVRKSPRSPAKAKNDPVSPATALVRRRQQRQTTAVAPVSPPPSNRKPRKATKTKVAASPALSALSSPPATPKAGRPVRDTPNNPFLIPSTPGRDTTLGAVLPRTPTKSKEGPTVTYVFRGVRGDFPNPHFDHSKGRAKSPTPNSLLPVDHPDYSPDAHALPRLLFPPKRVTRSMTKQEPGSSEQNEPKTPVKGTAKASSSRARLLSPFGEDDDEEGGDLRKMKPFTFRLKGSSSLKSKTDKGKAVASKSTKVTAVEETEETLVVQKEKRAVVALPKSKPTSSGKRS